MRQRFAWTIGMLLGAGFIMVEPAHAVIKKLTPLREVLAGHQYIFMAKVEKLDPDKPALILKVEENFKGEAPFKKLPINLTGDSEGQREKHTPILIKRMAADLPIILFSGEREGRYVTFAYTNGTWFQIVGYADKDKPDQVRWGFTHCEPYLRRTFKGTTEEMKKVLVEGLKEKKAPPDPDPDEKPGYGPEVKQKESGIRGQGSGVKGQEAGGRRQGNPHAALLTTSSDHSPFTTHAILTLTAHHSPNLAVIPTVVILGPLTLLASLFPAVFGVFMKRWLVLLSIVSLNSTLVVLHTIFYGQIKEYWWGSPMVLWTVMAAITMWGTVRSSKRYRRAVEEARDPNVILSGKKERAILWAAGVAAVGVVIWCFFMKKFGDRLWKELLAVWIPLGVGALYVGGLYLFTRKRPLTKSALAPEGAMLWTASLACLGLGATMLPRSQPLEARDSKLVWTFEPKNTSGTLVSSPLVTADRVYLATAESKGFDSFGTLYCLDRATGAEVWRFTDRGTLKQVSVSSPCLADGLVYIGEGFHEDKDCKVYCVNADTGEKVWEYQTQSHTESSPVVADGKVYIGAGDDGLFCLDAKTGDVLWHFEKLHVDARVTVAEGKVFAGSAVGDIYNATEIFCLDAKDGKEIWRMPMDLPTAGSPTVVGELVYFPLGNGTFMESETKKGKPAGALVCLQVKDGKRLWRFDATDSVLVQPVVNDHFLYFASRDQHCYCLDLNKAGKQVWKQDLGTPVVATPALQGKKLYVVASGGRVVCLNPMDGQINWSREVGTHSQTKPQFLASPRVVETSGVRRLYVGAGLDNGIGTTPTLFCLEEHVVGPAVAEGK